MKANDGSGNVPERDNWQTPQKLWDKLNKQYGFMTDCCASKENSKCGHYYSLKKPFHKFDSVLDDCCWMNPPFSDAKTMFWVFLQRVKKGVAIYRCDNMETEIWQNFILPYMDWVFIPKGRICYEGMEGKGSRFPSALIGIGVPIPEDLEGFTLKVGDN